VKLKGSDLNYNSINNSMKDIGEKKRSIEKRLVFENKKRNSSKLLRMLMNFGDFFVKEEKKNVWSMAGDYSEKINSLDKVLESPQGYLKRDYENLNKGFSNLCYSWVKSNEILNKLESDKLKYEIFKKNKSIFSKNPLKNYKEIKKLKQDIKETKEKIKTIKDKKNDLTKSLETFKVLFDKNQSDRLFLKNIKRDLNFHAQYLGFAGNSISDFDNYSGSSLNNEKVLLDYFKGNRNLA
jgi:hypothetical protein